MSDLAERDAKGRFFPGCKGISPGRPPRVRERAYLERVRIIVTQDEFDEVIRAALRDAKAGDPQARNFLMKFLCGDDPLELYELREDLDALRAKLGMPLSE